MINSKILQTWLAVCAALVFQSVQAQVLKLRPDGPNAQELGMSQAYKPCAQALLKPECRVGAWSAPASAFSRYTPPAIAWKWGFLSKDVDDFMEATQTTGLLIIHQGKVVAERYQYDRKPSMPMRSFSMAKTFTAMLVGIAHDKA